MRERKKKKKKLKSRRERNKRKAILKLSHYVKTAPSAPSVSTSNPGPVNHHPAFVMPPTQPPAASHDLKKTTAGMGEGFLTSPVGGMGEGSKNNGIPIFIQERLEERQKRRSDTESMERLLSDEVC